LTKIDPHITIDEKAIVRCKDSEHFIRKPFTIDHNGMAIEGPYKVLDAKSVTLRNASILIDKHGKSIFECAKRIEKYSSWSRLHYLVEEAGKDQKDGIAALSEFFGLRKDLRETEQTTLSLVLLRNPFSRQKFSIEGGSKVVSLDAIDVDNYDKLLDYMHSASRACVLSPDLRFGGSGAINVKQYLDFVDHNMHILSSRNKKPIFAPIQPEIPGKDIKEILEHYKLMGYVNIWLNFNGNQWDGPYFANVRYLLRVIDELFGTKESPGLNHACLYYSHGKKEHSPNLKSDTALSSDILSQFFGADFIGVNQSRRQGGPNKKKEEDRVNALIAKGEFKDRQDYQHAYRAHHNRIFDPDSYYYYKPDKYPRNLGVDPDFVIRDSINRLYNSALLRSEIDRTRSELGNINLLKPYLKKKKALMDNPYMMKPLFTDVPLDEKSLTAKLGGI
jgi:hypothetical protein